MSKWVTGAVLLLTILLYRPAAQAGCLGDCNGDGQITTGDLAVGVGIALGGELTACRSADFNGNGSVTVDDVVAVIDDAPTVCPYVGPFAGVVPLSGGQVGELDITVEPDGSASGTLTITDGSGSSGSGGGATVIDTANVVGTADLRTGVFSLAGVSVDGKAVSITGTFPSAAGTSSSVTVTIDSVPYTGSINAGNAVFTPAPTGTATATRTATRTPTPTATNTQGPPPTGQRLVYSGLNPTTLDPADIFVINVDGTGKRQLSQPGVLAYETNPAWSPDGNKIAFSGPSGSGYGITVINADGSNPHVLTSPEGGPLEYHPAWRLPTGSQIAFTSGGGAHVEVMNADGSGRHRIVSGTGGERYGHMSWSPDGSKIAFESTRQNQGGGDDGYEIWVMNADGTTLVRLTNNECPDHHPEWAPNGKILFARHPTLRCTAGIMSINPDGSGETRVFLDPFSSTAPSLSNDGQQLAYYTILGVKVGNATGANATLVPSTGGWVIPDFDLK